MVLSPRHLNIAGLSVMAAQYSCDCFVHPGVDLQVTIALRSEPQLYAAVGAYMRGLGEAVGIFYNNSKQPLAHRPPTDLAFVFH
jgi:hypothetical protein